MTIDSRGHRVQQPMMMEALVPSPARLEIAPTSESFSVGGPEPYATSPNSLYMYEQEKQDLMTADPVNPSVASPTLLSQAEEFDLKPQFENSNTLDISNMTPSSSLQAASRASRDFWSGKIMTLQESMDSGMRMDKRDLAPEPTLNELNLDDSLLDELNLESLLQNMDTSVFASGAPSPLPDSKTPSGVATPLQEVSRGSSSLMTVVAASKALGSLANDYSPAPISTEPSLGAQAVAAPPSYCGVVTVKQEPSDSRYETSAEDDKTLLHRLLLHGTALSRKNQQQQQQQQVLPSPCQSQKSSPPPSSALSPLKLQGSPSSSFRAMVSPVASATSTSANRSPKFNFSACPTTMVKEEMPSPPSCAMMGKAAPLPRPSASQPSGHFTRGVKRANSAVEPEDSQSTMEMKWKEIEQFIHEPKSEMGGHASRQPKKVRHESDNSNRTSSIDASSEVDSDDDSDNDFDSDLDASIGSPGEMSESLLDEKTTVSGKKKERQYFWQYNVQAKGPKGTRLRLLIDNSNPHELHNFEDPVFDPENTSVAGIRHGGKARKGDGNEVTPNPRKFYHIGLQIRRLNRQINDLGNTNDLPSSQRNSSRKLKNKLASRACRLKKKAQHEANKVKLFGLEQEHRRLMYILQTIERRLMERAASLMKLRQQSSASASQHQSLTSVLEELVQNHLDEMVAGNGTDFVNSVISKVEAGDWTGGLEIPKSKG